MYRLADRLHRPDTTFVWVDVSDLQYQTVFENIPHMATPRLIIAIAGKDPEQRRRVNNRICEAPSRPRGGSCTFYDVDARFASREQWLEYLRSLPDARPSDLWIRIGVDGVETVVHEDEYVFRSPWHLFVQMVCRPGVPGEWSQLAIVRQHPPVTRQMVIDAAQLIASRPINFER